jgi:hypothetical protein
VRQSLLELLSDAPAPTAKHTLTDADLKCILMLGVLLDVAHDARQQGAIAGGQWAGLQHRQRGV